jgi:sacsin
MRSLLEEPRSAAVADAFGWRTPLTATTLAKQLNAFGEAHATIAGEATGRALAAAVPRVYASLTSMLGTPAFEEALRAILTTDQDEQNAREEEEKETRASDETKEDVSSEDVPYVPKRSVAVGKKVVWVGVGFAEANAVAFDGALHLAPYLHVLPADLLSFKPLLAKLGVRERFEADDYVTLLFRLKADAGTETPLTERRLDVALWVLGALADFRTADGDERNENRRRVSETRQRDFLLSDLPVPDERGVLANASSCDSTTRPGCAPPPELGCATRSSLARPRKPRGWRRCGWRCCTKPPRTSG